MSILITFHGYTHFRALVKTYKGSVIRCDDTASADLKRSCLFGILSKFGTGPSQKRDWNQYSILKGSDDGVLHSKESDFWTLSIVQCFLKNTQCFGNWICFRNVIFLENIGRWTKSEDLVLSRNQ
jgi:hypothetical protein